MSKKHICLLWKTLPSLQIIVTVSERESQHVSNISPTKHISQSVSPVSLILHHQEPPKTTPGMSTKLSSPQTVELAQLTSPDGRTTYPVIEGENSWYALQGYSPIGSLNPESKQMSILQTWGIDLGLLGSKPNQKKKLKQSNQTRELRPFSSINRALVGSPGLSRKEREKPLVVCKMFPHSCWDFPGVQKTTSHQL